MFCKVWHDWTTILLGIYLLPFSSLYSSHIGFLSIIETFEVHSHLKVFMPDVLFPDFHIAGSFLPHQVLCPITLLRDCTEIIFLSA